MTTQPARRSRPATPAASPAADTLAFAAPVRPIVATGLARLHEELALCLPGWPGVPVASPAPEADVSIRPVDRRYAIYSDNLREGRSKVKKPLTAARWIGGVLAIHYVRQASEFAHVHAAGALCGQGLVVAFGRSEAGKSSLGLHLARQGQRLFGDDQLALRFAPDGVSGIAFGMAPRARLPLPFDAGKAYERFIAARAAARHGRGMILALRPGEFAGVGEEAPLATLLFLDRRDAGPARLDVLSPAATTHELLAHLRAPHLELPAIVRRARELSGTAPAYRLTYSNSADAAERVIERFGFA